MNSELRAAEWLIRGLGGISTLLKEIADTGIVVGDCYEMELKLRLDRLLEAHAKLVSNRVQSESQQNPKGE